MNPAAEAAHEASDIRRHRATPDSGPIESGDEGKAKRYEEIHTPPDVG
jgi:hypothetical protein